MTHYLYQEQNWQAQLSDLITDPLELLNILELSPEQLLSGALLASTQFKLRVPRAFVTRMQKGNPLDPLLLQVLPHHLELEEHPDFVTDPLGEEQANQQPGVLHKYKTRFLLTLTGACAVHCRYCFRRHFPYQENLPKSEDWINIQHYIQSQPDINEVIFSGGDPLTLSNRKIKLWIERLESIMHWIQEEQRRLLQFDLCHRSSPMIGLSNAGPIGTSPLKLNRSETRGDTCFSPI